MWRDAEEKTERKKSSLKKSERTENGMIAGEQEGRKRNGRTNLERIVCTPTQQSKAMASEQVAAKDCCC